MDEIDFAVWEMWERIRRARISAEAKKAVWLHLHKPWVPNHKGILISPNRPGLEAYLDKPVGVVDDRVWHLPGFKWWKSHWERSHKGGAGCDVRIHSQFLAADRPGGPEFYYANLLHSGDVVVLTSDDFRTECNWWKRNF